MTAYGTPIGKGVPGGERTQVKLGRYEVVRELGKGAMGVVYLAKDPLIGRLVALKTIRPAQHGDDDETKEFQQRFIREAQAAGILNHPAIVTVHDIGLDEASGVSFIAMEYVEGYNLKEVLAQGRPLGFDQIGELVAQVADALDFAHSKGIVHRDVKPANIILIEGNRAKITDFGIAKITSGGNLTSTGQFLGTPNYMAPEQIKGAPVDGRTDIFSLGICLYECLTRRKPFGGDSLTSISYKIVHEPFPPLHELNPQIPEGYDEVVAQCLAKEPSRRYQRGKDLATAIHAVLRGERPVKPVDPVLGEQTMVTRDRERLPTIEVPFPEATPQPATARPPAPPPPPTAAIPKAARPRLRPGELMRNTLDGVRTHPVWTRRMPTPLVIAVIGIIAAITVLAVLSIKSKFAPPAQVDQSAESRVSRERHLRIEGARLLKDGRVSDAYKRFEELKRLAPQSPYVASVMDKLSQVLRQEESGKQRLATAMQKYDQGVALYNEKKYADAITLLSESFSLNPDSEDTANYLKLAQQEEARERAAARSRTAPPVKSAQKPVLVTPTSTRASVVPPPATSGRPASLTTSFASPVADGYIMVKAGADVLAHENLWQETGRMMFRRRTPRQINVTKEFPPKNADLEIWVVIPTLHVEEHRVIPRQNFQAGVNRKLQVSFDPESKRFDYVIN